MRLRWSAKPLHDQSPWRVLDDAPPRTNALAGIELCVRWYSTHRLSYRDLAAMMAERDVGVSHTTLSGNIR